MVNFISLTLKESIINSSQLFMSPFSADSLRNCLFRLLNNCDCYKFTATPCALNMHLECWPPAAISLSLCLSFIQITQLFSFSISHSLSEPSYRLKELAPTYIGKSVFTLRQLLFQFMFWWNIITHYPDYSWVSEWQHLEMCTHAGGFMRRM